MVKFGIGLVLGLMLGARYVFEVYNPYNSARPLKADGEKK